MMMDKVVQKTKWKLAPIQIYDEGDDAAEFLVIMMQLVILKTNDANPTGSREDEVKNEENTVLLS